MAFIVTLVFFVIVYGVLIDSYRTTIRVHDVGDIPMDILDGLRTGKQWHVQEAKDTFATQDGWSICKEGKIFKLTFLDPEDESLIVYSRYHRNTPEAKALRAIFEKAAKQVEWRRQVASDQAKALAEAEKVADLKNKAKRHERMRRTLTGNAQDGELSLAADMGGELSMEPQSDNTKPI